MEATSELLQKLQRRRERMGERSPLKDISSNSAAGSRSKDFEAGKVQQCRNVFEGIENQAALYNTKPGKIDLGRWEQKIHEDPPGAQPIDIHAATATPPFGDFAVAEDPTESTPTSPNVACIDISVDSIGASPAECDTHIKADASEKLNLVEGMQLCPFPASSCRQFEAIKPESSTAPPSPLVEGMQICPFPSSRCRVIAAETPATAVETPAMTSEQSNSATNGFPSGAASQCSGKQSPLEQAIFMLARHASTVALSVSEEDRVTWNQTPHVGDMDMNLQEASTWFGCKAAPPGCHLGPRPDVQSFSTQILKPLRDWAATLQQQQSESCIFNHLPEGDSATPSPIKNSSDSAVTASIDVNNSNSKEGNDRDFDGNSPAWEDGPEPLEYFLLDYHGVLPEDLLEKIKKNVEMHASCMRKLKRENDRLRREARQRSEGEHDGVGLVEDDVDVPKVVSVPQTPVETRQASPIRVTHVSRVRRPFCSPMPIQAPCRSLPMVGGRMQSEIARTEARVAELEEAIRREGQKLREKDSERKAVAREVEAIRCEARAHRAKLNKHIG